MSRLLGLCLLLAAGVVLADDTDPEPIPLPEAELKKMQGVWDVVKAVKGGVDETKEKKGSTLTFRKNTVSILEVGGNAAETCTFALDPKKKPAHIDITVKNDVNLIKGIYKFTKDELTITFGEPGSERPKGFDANDARVTIVLKRQKAK